MRERQRWSLTLLCQHGDEGADELVVVVRPPLIINLGRKEPVSVNSFIIVITMVINITLISPLFSSKIRLRRWAPLVLHKALLMVI